MTNAINASDNQNVIVRFAMDFHNGWRKQHLDEKAHCHFVLIAETRPSDGPALFFWRDFVDGRPDWRRRRGLISTDGHQVSPKYAAFGRIFCYILRERSRPG